MDNFFAWYQFQKDMTRQNDSKNEEVKQPDARETQINSGRFNTAFKLMKYLKQRQKTRQRSTERSGEYSLDRASQEYL